MNFGELKTLIINFSHRTDLLPFVNTFVQLAEARIAKVVRANEMVRTLALTVDEVNGPVLALPDDFLGLRTLNGTSNGQSYQLKSVSFAELNRFSSTGRPLYFTIFGSSIEFRGTPPVGDIHTLIYFARPAALVNNEDTNDLLDAFPDIYLRAALIELYIFTQDLELGTVQDAFFTEEVDRLNALGDDIRGSSAVASSFNFDFGGAF